MKITIFGANGQIGQLLVKQALQAGYDVTAYTRRPNFLQRKTLNSLLQCCQASCLGYSCPLDTQR
jgi:uncharacterized protein YbjT (DUF2867 family)